MSEAAAAPQPHPKFRISCSFASAKSARCWGSKLMSCAIGKRNSRRLSPKKSGTGHRLYRRKDVELLSKIKHLLYEKRFTIDGARQYLQAEAKAANPKDTKQEQQVLFQDPLPEIRKRTGRNPENVEVDYSVSPTIAA